jgi:photosystem II stability/assembly factor-like uncharacterized protein
VRYHDSFVAADGHTTNLDVPPSLFAEIDSFCQTTRGEGIMRYGFLTLLALLTVVMEGNAQALRSFTVTKDSLPGNLPNASVWFVTENSGSTWITGDSSLVAKADTSNLSVWTVLNGGIPDTVQIAWLEFLDPMTIYAAGGNGAIYKTTDGGNTWISVYYNPSLTKYINRITFFNANHGMACGDGLSPSSTQAWLETTDGGSNWTNNNTRLIGTNTPYNIRFVSPTGVFVAGFQGPQQPNLWGVYRSTDLGRTWVFSIVGTTSKDSTTQTFSVDFRDNLVGSACRRDSTLWSTSDGGITWQQIGSRLPTWFFYACFVKSTNTAMFAGIGNASVAAANLDTRSILVYQDTTKKNLSFNYGMFPTLTRGYMSNGLHRRFYSIVFSTPTEVRTETRMPSDFSMAQNFPNPFNPTTTIRYGLPQRSNVLLTVFNTLGQKVESLVQETQDVGYHEVRFDGSALASGVYFYRIQAGAYGDTKKLLILR